MRRNVLVVGATGKQGQAIIRAILRFTNSQNEALNDTEDQENQEFQIYALTRNAANMKVPKPGVTVVVGDLDIPDTIKKIFDDVKTQDGGFWGVVVVLMYPGLEVAADGEERQGKMLANLALEYGVQSFVYSSGCRAGPKYEHLLTLSGKAKAAIENHCKKVGEQGLPWTIIRPGFFMENFNGVIGSITASVLKAGLAPATTFGLVCADDVGRAVLAIFTNHKQYLHRELAIVGQVSTMSEVESEHQAATGKPLSVLPITLGWMLLQLNSGLRDLIMTMDRCHHARSNGDYPLWETEVIDGNSTCKFKNYCQWLSQRATKDAENAWGWNQISLLKLITGRS